MKHKNWSEDELEHLLKKMPDISDNRSKEDIFSNIQTRINARKSKKKMVIFSSLATCAAAVAFFTLLPTNEPDILNAALTNDSAGNHLVENNIQGIQQHSADSQTGMTSSGISGFGIASVEKSGIVLSSNKEENYNGVVLNVDLSKEAVTIAVPDNQAQHVIPITFFIENSDMNDAEKLNELNKQIGNMPHGLSDFLLKDATFSEIDKKTLHILVNDDHQFNAGTAATMMFWKTVEAILKYSQYDKATISTRNGKGIDLSNMGKVYEINQNTAKAIYFSYEVPSSSQQFLVPLSVNELTFEEALRMGAKDNDRLYESVIPSNFIRSVETKGATAVIKVNDQKLINNVSAIMTIDAILMVAKEYGYSHILIEGSPNKLIGKYNLTKEILVPKRPNGITSVQ